MKIREIEINNFRKFRQPKTISGFSDGLNIVVEPNETGKSTILEALRAALFIRHSAKTELTRSFCPTGDDVAPRVALTFEIDGGIWRLEKQFLRSAAAKLSGPSGRFESDAAEERLQEMFGFERGNNRGTDLETRGPLGLLWVEQTSALKIEAPSARVCDTVRSALEGEIGAILGGRRFEAVRAAVETAYADLRTVKSGRSTGRLQNAEARLAQAKAARASAEEQVQAYESSLTELEMARTRKRLIERDLADPEQKTRRQQLQSDLRLGEDAAIKLTAAQARHDETRAKLTSLEGQLSRIATARTVQATAGAVLAKFSERNEEAEVAHEAAVAIEAELRIALASARAARNKLDRSVRDARTALGVRTRAVAINGARTRLAELEGLEAELKTVEAEAPGALDADAIAELERLDRAVVAARAIASANAVAVNVQIHDETAIRIDGAPAGPGLRPLGGRTVIEIGRHATLTLLPSAADGVSAAAREGAAEDALATTLARHRVNSLADAVSRNELARRAADRVAGIRRQITTLCVAETTIGLDAGPAALKLLVSSLSKVPPPEEDIAASADFAALDAALSAAIDAEQETVGRHEVATEALRQSETETAERRRKIALAERDLETASAQLEQMTAGGVETLETKVLNLREELQRRRNTLGEANTAATTFEVAVIRSRLENMLRADEKARREREDLIATIAGLEATIQRLGPKGLPGVLANAVEEEQATAEGLQRLIEEADMLALLRNTLAKAADDASRTFLGPVTRRAAHYISRIVPGSDLTFDERLSLTSITRGGLTENTDNLSRGTQEQLAVLTRLAFADLLLDRGSPVSLILDDPLVYSDDARLDAMTDILTEASARVQVILLTCRERAFRHLDARRILL